MEYPLLIILLLTIMLTINKPSIALGVPNLQRLSQEAQDLPFPWEEMGPSPAVEAPVVAQRGALLAPVQVRQLQEVLRLNA